MQIIDMPANYDGYPEHDHSEDGQEEVYLTLRGAGEIEIEGDRYPLDEDHVAKVGPGIKRKVWPGTTGSASSSSAAVGRGLRRPGHHQARRARPDGGAEPPRKLHPAAGGAAQPPPGHERSSWPGQAATGSRG